MSLKAELETWAAALKAYDEDDFERSLSLFGKIADSSKIRTNMGLIYATIGEHEAAVENFMAATTLDKYLAVAYFQCGVSNFLLERYNQALSDFSQAYLHLRGNQIIYYEQIGLNFRLYSAEVLFNKALCQVYMGEGDRGLKEMKEAQKEKVTEEHNVIDDAIRDRGEDYTVFSIPVGILYRPSDIKLKNAKAKDYLGKAKLVASAEATDAFTSFTGSTRLMQGQMPSGAPLDNARPDIEDRIIRQNSTRTPPPALTRAVTTAARVETTASSRNGPPMPDAKAALQKSQSASVAPLVRSRSAGEGLRDRYADPAPVPTPASTRSGLSRGFSTRRPTEQGGSLGVDPLKLRSRSRPSSPPRERERERERERDRDRDRERERERERDRERERERERERDRDRERERERDRERARTMSPSRRAMSPPRREMTPPRRPMSPPRMQPSSTRSSSNSGDGYRDLIDGYIDEPPSMPALPNDAVRWTSRASPPLALSRSVSTRGRQGSGDSAFGGSAGGGSLRRKLSRRPTYGRNGSSGDLSVSRRMGPVYGEEEEGYASTEYDEGPWELMKIRVKLHYQGELRGMTLKPDMPFRDFMDMVQAKFNSKRKLKLVFKDEDGGMVSLRDESDYDLAIETAKEFAGGKPEGKLELWCEEA
ncbi:hypothetical protein BOTBODRAFT_55680 [Botryobasidium botryosum FD-172 SS1]|uniref:PB1 domain-containing protein n=1 Tax=Botryobasidium botryosum (strain FD-172 SS1) TaxID=930990 RepID=A0A067MPY5_BOTB1|nr:hypothetical protein BOTBODRAFT_55680 [Botryobasidium botryosum FD-172 SS1]